MDLLLSTISSSDKNHINLIPFVRDLLNKMVEELRHQFLFMDQFPPHPNDFFLKPLATEVFIVSYFDFDAITENPNSSSTPRSTSALIGSILCCKCMCVWLLIIDEC